MAVDHEALVAMLTRLKLTAIRDGLDSLLDEAARRDLTLREALAFLCDREVARKDERRIEMALKIAHFPCAARARRLRLRRPAEPRSASRSASSPPAAGSPTATRCCCSVRPASARPIWRSRSAARRSGRATRCCSSPRRRWSRRWPRPMPTAGSRSGSPSSPSRSC